MTSERKAYVYIQRPGTLDTAPAALLKVQTLPDGTQIGRFRYGDRYLGGERRQVMPRRVSLMASMVSACGNSGSRCSAFSWATRTSRRRRASDTVSPMVVSTTVFADLVRFSKPGRFNAR